MAHIKKEVFSFFLTLLATAFGVFLGIFFTNLNVSRQDTNTAIKLLQIASEDIAYQSRFIKEMTGNLDIENLESDADLKTLENTIDKFVLPGINVPYPVVFDKIVDDERVFSRLSYTGMRSIYRIQDSLENEKRYILGLENEMQDFLIANTANTAPAIMSKTEFIELVDFSVKINSLTQYISHLDVLSSLLNVQISYIQGSITEDEARDSTFSIEQEIFKNNSTPSEQKSRLEQLEQLGLKLTP